MNRASGKTIVVAYPAMSKAFTRPVSFFDTNKWGVRLPYITILFFGSLYLVMVFCNHFFFRTWTYDYGSYNFAFYDYAHFRVSECPQYIPGMTKSGVQKRPEWMDKGVPYLERGKRDVGEYYKKK